MYLDTLMPLANKKDPGKLNHLLKKHKNSSKAAGFA